MPPQPQLVKQRLVVQLGSTSYLVRNRVEASAFPSQPWSVLHSVANVKVDRAASSMNFP